MTYDIITFGETMLRFSPPDLQRFEQAREFEAHIGGSESNVAVGLARLGLRVAWISRLTQNALGGLIANTIRAHGVDTSQIIWTTEDRIGLYFYETGASPRGGQVIYDRANSAMSRIRSSDLPQNIFVAEAAKILHLSGISSAISKSAAETNLQAAQWAKAAGWRLSFDVNYRALLWSPEAAVETCHPIAELADIIFLPLRDAVKLYKTENDAKAAIKALQSRYPQAQIVLTLGKDGAMSSDKSGEIFSQATFPAEEIGRLGRGDAFVAGFLYGFLEYGDTKAALLWGTAAAAYKSSILGDLPVFQREELARLIQDNQGSQLVR
jgi:2-dehydro-3-deoxygluconokinase